MRSEALARLDGVTKVYRTPVAEVRALREVSAEFPRGALTAVVGPSGSGKSSLLRLLAGMDRPTGGHVWVNGVSVGSSSERGLRRLRRHTVGYVFQRPSDNFISYLTVGEHLRLAAGRTDPARGRRILERLGIAHRADHHPAELSGGEQQRAAFAQALVAGARLIVADEPTAELDGSSGAAVLKGIRELVGEGVTFVLATHDPAVRRAADDVLVLDHGRVVHPSPARPAAGSPPIAASPGKGADPLGSVVVEASGVTKSFRRGAETVHALRGVTLRLDEGEVVGLIGRSGSGKTTLLGILAGWEPPDAGAVRWPRGMDPGPLPRWSHVAILPQRLGLIEELTVQENVDYPARLAGAPPGSTDRVGELLERLGLDALADRYPPETSVGEQQRTALARALVLGPRLLLADEPTGHQDSGWAARVLEALRAAAAYGTTCLVATHNEEALPFTDRVLRIRDGVIMETAPPGYSRA